MCAAQVKGLGGQFTGGGSGDGQWMDEDLLSWNQQNFLRGGLDVWRKQGDALEKVSSISGCLGDL